jgi:hypothetical protein
MAKKGAKVDETYEEYIARSKQEWDASVAATQLFNEAAIEQIVRRSMSSLWIATASPKTSTGWRRTIRSGMSSMISHGRERQKMARRSGKHVEKAAQTSPESARR